MILPLANEEISVFDLEDKVNTALNATLMMHDVLERFLHSVPSFAKHLGEEANTGSYAIGHCREMVRAAYEEFHAFMAQEIAKAKAA